MAERMDNQNTFFLVFLTLIANLPAHFGSLTDLQSGFPQL